MHGRSRERLISTSPVPRPPALLPRGPVVRGHPLCAAPRPDGPKVDKQGLCHLLPLSRSSSRPAGRPGRSRDVPGHGGVGRGHVGATSDKARSSRTFANSDHIFHAPRVAGSIRAIASRAGAGAMPCAAPPDITMARPTGEMATIADLRSSESPSFIGPMWETPIRHPITSTQVAEAKRGEVPACVWVRFCRACRSSHRLGRTILAAYGLS
jgi:hypothetical protein